MRGKPLFAAVTVAVAALAGTASAATAPTAPTAAKGGTVHLVDYTDNDGATTTAVLSGAVGDLGTGIGVRPDGTISPDHTQLNLVLSQGSFRLDIADIDQKFISALSTTPFQPGNNSCSGHVSVTGWAGIVAGSGTGAYRGISGGFHLTITADEVDAPDNGNCDASGAMLGQAIITQGTGTVAFS